MSFEALGDPRPITVYLDSSDYSRISDPRRSAEMSALREKLKELASRPSVSFVFSSAHLSEMAPLESRYADAASARADVLVELCGRNALIALPTLMEEENDRLRREDNAPVTAINSDGTWFPDVGMLLTPVQWVDNLKTHLTDQVTAMGLNRKLRRHVRGKILKRGGVRSGALACVQLDLDELVAHYPMRKQDAAVLAQYALGRASAAEANSAFLESLRDPSWMMRWFQDHHDTLGPIGALVRKPAGKMFDRLHEAQALMKNSPVEPLLISRLLDNVLRDIAFRALGDDATIPFDVVARVDRFCPGLATMVRVMTSSLRNSFGANPRSTKASDFVDAMHAMYAPYVNIFRTDRYMAPIVQAQVERFGTVVLGRLEELPGAIEALLRQRVSEVSLRPSSAASRDP